MRREQAAAGNSDKSDIVLLCTLNEVDTNLLYLIDSLFDLAETDVEVHLLLLQLTAFLIEQVGILVDKVQVVARSDGHCVSTSLSQTVVSLCRVTNTI